jgi:hypothetical protein
VYATRSIVLGIGADAVVSNAEVEDELFSNDTSGSLSYVAVYARLAYRFRPSVWRPPPAPRNPDIAHVTVGRLVAEQERVDRAGASWAGERCTRNGPK